MLIKTSSDTNRSVVRQLAPRQAVSALPVEQTAANASRWINEDTQGRRLRLVAADLVMNATSEPDRPLTHTTT